MFIHLGGDTLVHSKSIIMIINAENAMGANSTKEFLKKAHEKGCVNNSEEAAAKSIVVTDKKVFLSPISSLTLKKRANFVANLA